MQNYCTTQNLALSLQKIKRPDFIAACQRNNLVFVIATGEIYDSRLIY